MAVAFEELIDSPHVRIDEGRFSATRRFKVAWNDTIAFCVELCGGWTQSGGSLTFVAPATFPGVPEAFCRSADFAPFPPDRIVTPASASLTGNTNQPEFALVTASYLIDATTNARQQRNSLQALAPTGTYVSLHTDIGVQRTTVPGKAVKIDNKPAEPQGVYGVDLPTEQFTLVWERVPYLLVPWQAILQTRGLLNQDLFHTYPQDCVMFQGAQLHYDFQFSGDVLCKLHYRFLAKTARGTGGQTLSGWTHTFSGDTGTFETIKAANGSALYQRGDFTRLFTFEPSV